MIRRIRDYFKDITGNVRVFGVASFFNDASTEMIYPLLPIFLTKVLGASVGFVGVIEGIAESTAAIAKLLSGWYSDRIRARKNISVLGYAVSTLTRPAIAIATMPWHVLAARFVDRVGKGVRTSPRDALIASSVEPSVRGKAFGFHRGMDNAGAIVGPAAALLVFHFRPGDYRFLFWIALLPGLLAVWAIWRYAVEIAPPAGGEGKGPAKLSWSKLDKNLRNYILVVFLFTLGNSSDAFLILRAEDLGVTTAMIPLIWMVLNAVKVFTGMPGGSLSDRIGRRRTIILGWIVYALIYGGFAVAGLQWHAWVLFALYGIYFGLTEGAERALVSDLTDEETSGTAFGFYHLAVGAASFPASVIFGYVWKMYSAEAAFLMGASFAILAAVLLMATVRHSPRIPHK